MTEKPFKIISLGIVLDGKLINEVNIEIAGPGLKERIDVACEGLSFAICVAAEEWQREFIQRYGGSK